MLNKIKSTIFTRRDRNRAAAAVASVLMMTGVLASTPANAAPGVGEKTVSYAAGCPASVMVDDNNRTGIVYGYNDTCYFQATVTCQFTSTGTTGGISVTGYYARSFDCGYRFISFKSLS